MLNYSVSALRSKCSSRIKIAHTSQDEFVKIAEILLHSTDSGRMKHTALSFYNFICAKSIKFEHGGQPARLPTSFLKSFFFLVKKKVDLNNHLFLLFYYQTRL